MWRCRILGGHWSYIAVPKAQGANSKMDRCLRFLSWPNNVPFCARILRLLYLFGCQLASRSIPCSACCEDCWSTSLHGADFISCRYLPQVERPDRAWAGSVPPPRICHNLPEKCAFPATPCGIFPFSSPPFANSCSVPGHMLTGVSCFTSPCESEEFGLERLFCLGLIWFEVILFFNTRKAFAFHS